jgi:hypothetical protein
LARVVGISERPPYRIVDIHVESTESHRRVCLTGAFSEDSHPGSVAYLAVTDPAYFGRGIDLNLDIAANQRGRTTVDMRYVNRYQPIRPSDGRDHNSVNDRTPLDMS